MCRNALLATREQAKTSQRLQGRQLGSPAAVPRARGTPSGSAAMSFRVTCEIVQPTVAEDAPPPPPISLRYDWQGEAVTTSDWTAAGTDPAGSRATSRPATADGSRPATADGEEEEEAPPPVPSGPLDPPQDAPCLVCEKTHSIATSDEHLPCRGLTHCESPQQSSLGLCWTGE